MEDLKNEIYKLEVSLTEAETLSSVEKLNQIFADDFIEYGTSGMIYNKNTLLKFLPTNLETKYKLYDFEIIKLANDVIQTRFKTDRIHTDGTQVTSLRSSLWKKDGDKWQIHFHQGTPLIKTGYYAQLQETLNNL